MSTTLVSEGRKLHSTGNGHVKNGKHIAPQNDRDALLNEIMRLVDASKEGRLTERGRATIFNGPDRELIQGVNEILDASFYLSLKATVFWRRSPTAKSMS